VHNSVIVDLTIKIKIKIKFKKLAEMHLCYDKINDNVAEAK
jgi:hypothetical protein